MNKRYKSNQFKKVPYLLALVIVLLSVGYSAFGTDMNLSNIVAKIRLKKDVRISSVIVSSTEVDASSSYQEYNVNRLIAGITLPESDSTITFSVGIVNLGNVEAGILKINNLPDNLDYEFINYNLKDKICDKEDSTKCSLGATSEIKLKIKYKDDTSYDSSNTSFSLDLELDIEPFHTVNYTNITNNGYPTEVLGGNSLTVNFGDTEFNFLKVLIDDVVTYDYSFNNGVLTIYEVTGDVNIIDEAPIYLTNLVINGNSLQEGKNLFKTTGNVVGTITPATNVINSGYKWATTTDYIYLQKGTYTISYKEGVNLRHVVLFDNDKNYVNHYWSNRANPYTFTLDSNYYVRIDFERDGNVDIDDINTFYQEYEIQLEKGSVATEYEAYTLPSPENPIEILSVGEKTTNLINNYNVKEATSTPGSLTGAVITNEYIDVVRQTKYDYNVIPTTLEAGKSYTLWVEFTVYDRPEEATDSTVVYVGFRNITSASNMVSIYSNKVDSRLFNFTVSEDTTEDLMLYANYGSTVPGKVKFRVMLLEGTYTKDNLPEYEPYGYKIPVKVSGKNLLNSNITNLENWESGTRFLIDLSAGEYYFDINYIVESSNYGYVYLQKRLPEETTWTNVVRPVIGDYFQERILFSIEEGYEYCFWWYGENEKFNNLKNWQIRNVTEDADYEPYVEPITTNIYLDEPLRKVGDYADYIDLSTGILSRNIKEIELNGTETWNLYSGTSSVITVYSSFPDSTKKYNSSLSSHFTNVIYAWSQSRTGIYSDHDSNNLKYFKAPNDSITTVEGFTSWLASQKTAGTPVKLTYTLDSPSTTSIDIPLIKMNGYSNVSVNTEIKPSNITWTVE